MYPCQFDRPEKSSQLDWSGCYIALSKSAYEYLHILNFLVFTGAGFQKHFKLSLIPLWPELPNGGITSHATSWEGNDSSTRSISVEFPEELMWVGWGTTCVSTKLCKKKPYKTGDAFDYKKSILKSPNSTKLDKTVASKLSKTVQSSKAV